MEFPKGVAVVKLGQVIGDEYRYSITQDNNELLPAGDYVAIPKEQYDAFYRQNVSEQLTETQTREPTNMVCRMFEGDSIGNPVVEILAMMLFYDRLNVRHSWQNIDHEQRQRYRNVAAGNAEFPSDD